MAEKFKKRGNRKAQLSVFIIIAVIIAVILMIIFLNKEQFDVFFGEKTSLEQVQKCINNPASELVKNLESQGGVVEPKNYFLYEGNKIEYACYTGEYYKKCIMQKPMLKQEIEKELKKYLEPKIDDCLNAMKSSLEKKGYSMLFKKPEVSVEIIPDNLMIRLNNLNLVISKENTESYKDLKLNVNSKLYELVMTASSILNWEATYGETETLNYMLFYPSLKVEKKMQSDGSKIYILTNRETLEKFMFAVRSLAYPPGITGE